LLKRTAEEFGQRTIPPEEQHFMSHYPLATPPTVFIVDDDSSFRTAMTRLLRGAGYEVRAYASASDFLAADPVDRLGCVVLDVQMPELSGLDLQQTLLRMAVPLPIIFLTGHGDIPMSVRAMKAGAVDFLTKPVRREILLSAIENAIKCNASERAARAAVQDLQARYAKLTPREREVFGLVVSGKLNKQIAFELGTVERTVKAHRAKIVAKMKVDSLAELVRAAVQLGLVEGSSSETAR
jgi:FixJ family two-component response regulator